MNILFSTQSVGLKIFYHLLDEIKEPLKIDKVGFYTTQSMYYSQFVKQHPDLESNYTVVKEWQIVGESRKLKPNLDKIRAYEKAIGNPTLWEPIICDRRVYLGRLCKVKQDYRPSFSHEQMLSILHVALEQLEQLLDKVKPDIVLSLDPVTLGDYILYLFCRARNIPMFFLRTTKIENFIEFNEGIFGCSAHIYKTYEEYESLSVEDQWIKQAEEYLQIASKKDVRYEGMIFIPSKRKTQKPKTSFIKSLVKSLKTEITYLLKYRNDHSIPSMFTSLVYKKFISPFKAKIHNWRYSKYYVSQDQLDSVDFAFYPLQSEPEISSLIWGKSYMNHIETARNVARSLPVGMKLLVKEHPRALGYRSFSYYKKLLDIPNVLLAHPDQEVRTIIQKSQVVISLATFVGFEAVILQKPSLMLGGPRPFSILPDSMVRYVHSMNDLASEIADLVENYEYKERPLINYIASTMKGSVAIDYFTTLLKKKGRHGDSRIDNFDEEIKKLAIYTTNRIIESLNANKQMSSV
jgi:hypothetical protein